MAAFNRIIVANLEGRDILAGWTIDKDGKPNVKASEALTGAVVPFGDYKGSGLDYGSGVKWRFVLRIF